jgi:dimeric dUTPase (all-alpha-NTP-PPase superfamily)
MVNTELTPTIIESMLHVQDGLNIVTMGEAWWKGKKDWNTAIFVECAEGIDHLGWKWWSKQEQNIPAAKVEAIDILHFALSRFLQTAYFNRGIGPRDVVAHEQMAMYLQMRNEVIAMGGKVISPVSISSIELFRLCGALAASDRETLPTIFSITDSLGMSACEVANLYRQKAMLNYFRQMHGYREGTYIKVWHREDWERPLEDNDVMQSLAHSIDWSHGNAADQLYAKLDEVYLSIVR